MANTQTGSNIVPHPLTFADGYADAMQGNPKQSQDEEYVSGYDSLDEEVNSGFADLEAMFETPGAKNVNTQTTP